MSPVPAPPHDVQQMRSALVAANQKRTLLSEFRRQVRAGLIPIDEALMNPPACAHHLYVFEVLMLSPGIQRMTLERLGREALAARVNLLVTVGRAGQRTRTWAIANLPARAKRGIAA